MSREQILGRLHSASWTKGLLPVGAIGLAKLEAGDVNLFTSKAQAAGALVERVNDPGEARELLTNIIKEQQVSAVIGTDETAVNDLRLPELSAEYGFNYRTCAGLRNEEYREYVNHADLGISGCSYGVAETGTLVLTHNHRNERLVSHAPDHYIGLIFREQILTDRFALTAVLQTEMSPPAAWTLITGVSRTADVALQVVLGMHGPRKVTIIIIG